MKRVIAVSDSHGAVDNLREAIAMALDKGKIDVLVFLGDGHSDMEALRPQLTEKPPETLLYMVGGNNDWRYQSPPFVLFQVNGVRFYACHGHQWQVKYGLQRLCYAAKEKEARVALYGHTHRSHFEMEYGLFLINPGAICEMGTGKVAYADIRVDVDGQVKADFAFCP